MTITLSGANTVVRLNDHTNYRFRASNQPSIGRYLRTGTYTEETDSFVIDVVGSGVNQNLKNLFLLQNSVQSWKETGIDPVQVLYSGENGKEYYTLVTNLDVRIPSTYYDYDTLQGVVGVELDVTRKGAYLSRTVESMPPSVQNIYANSSLIPNYYPIDVITGFSSSGSQTTLSGLTRQTYPSPSTIVISGIKLTANDISCIPEGYLFTASRTNYGTYPKPVFDTGVSATFLPIRYAILSNTFTLSSGTYANLFDSQRSFTVTSGTNVVRTTFGDGSSTIKNKNIFNINSTVEGSVITTLRAHNKTHVFCTLRNTAPVDWSVSFLGSSTTSGTSVNPELATWQHISDKTMCITSGETDPVVRYLGTISRPQNMALSSVGMVFQPSRDFAAERNVPLASGSLLFQNLYFVVDTPETSIIKVMRTPMKIASGESNSFIVINPGFINDQPSVYATLTEGNTISGVINNRVFATPVEYRGNLPYTSADVMRFVFAATSNGSWSVTSDTASGLPNRYGIHFERPDVTLLPGVS